jgi:hypothetical protein
MNRDKNIEEECIILMHLKEIGCSSREIIQEALYKPINFSKLREEINYRNNKYKPMKGGD